MYYPYQTLRSTRELYIDDFFLSLPPPPPFDFALANTLFPSFVWQIDKPVDKEDMDVVHVPDNVPLEEGFKGRSSVRC